MSRGYGEYCPIAKASEVLGERWTPFILRNIHLRCHSFTEIQRGCPRMSSTLRSQRLRSLERDGVIARVPAPSGRGSRYYLTPGGQEPIEVVLQMGHWGARWLDLGPRDYEPEIVLWGWAKFIDAGKLPPSRVVVRFDLTDRPRQHFWMLIDRPESEVCVKHPGLDEDLVVVTDCVTLRARCVRGGTGLGADADRRPASAGWGFPDLGRAQPLCGCSTGPVCLRESGLPTEDSKRTRSRRS
jgi:DNA-binding HxlR family transcriptional regulator